MLRGSKDRPGSAQSKAPTPLFVWAIGIVLSLVFSACGPGKALQPLVGEGRGIHDSLESDPALLRTTAPIESAKRLLGYIRAGNREAVYASLSRDSHQSYSLPENLTSAPVRESVEIALLGSLVEEFVERSPREVLKGLPSPHPRRASVTVKSKQGPERTIFFELEEEAWLLDLPTSK